MHESLPSLGVSRCLAVGVVRCTSLGDTRRQARPGWVREMLVACCRFGAICRGSGVSAIDLQCAVCAQLC